MKERYLTVTVVRCTVRILVDVTCGKSSAVYSNRVTIKLRSDWS